MAITVPEASTAPAQQPCRRLALRPQHVLQNDRPNSANIRKPQPDHHAEAPEHRPHARHGIVDRLVDHLGRGLPHVGRVFLEHVRPTGLQVLLMDLQGLERRCVAGVLAHRRQCGHRLGYRS
ncbi:hypothetical protein ACU4HD_25215 [Cupriavidus basilensis]